MRYLISRLRKFFGDLWFRWYAWRVRRGVIPADPVSLTAVLKPTGGGYYEAYVVAHGLRVSGSDMDELLENVRTLVMGYYTEAIMKGRRFRDELTAGVINDFLASTVWKYDEFDFSIVDESLRTVATLHVSLTIRGLGPIPDSIRR